MGHHDTKTFRSGNSEAVRIPKELAFGIGRELTIERIGERVVLSPKIDRDAERRKVRELLDALAAIGAPDDGVQPRPDFEAPERPGL